ncbi:MAG: glycosyltransferase family 8 protein [Clostridia bacterium]|nr:glycosyltransferase family 8 protein [Clostridia bacterium]
METIKPAFSNNLIPICFSANDRYIPLLSTTIESIIENSSPENNYDIVILMTSIDIENQTNILKQIANHKNFSIRFVNVGPLVFGYKFYTWSEITNTKYTDEIYYRVLVPSIMSEYTKVLFLDADLIVEDDVAKLFQVDLSNNLIGAIRDYEGIAACYSHNFERTKYRINEIGITNFDNYFASGVMLLNIEEFNSKFDTTNLLNLAISKDWKQYDQDLFNYVAKDSVVILDAAWDFMEDQDGSYAKLPEHLFNEYLESEKNPKIIHYAGTRKPWLRTNSKFNDNFWKYAQKTEYLKYLLDLKNHFE